MAWYALNKRVKFIYGDWPIKMYKKKLYNDIPDSVKQKHRNRAMNLMMMCGLVRGLCNEEEKIRGEGSYSSYI